MNGSRRICGGETSPLARRFCRVDLRANETGQREAVSRGPGEYWHKIPGIADAIVIPGSSPGSHRGWLRESLTVGVPHHNGAGTLGSSEFFLHPWRTCHHPRAKNAASVPRSTTGLESRRPSPPSAKWRSSRRRITTRTTRNAIGLSAAASPALPCSSANSARVTPHVGQSRPVSHFTGQRGTPGSVGRRATEAKPPTRTAVSMARSAPGLSLGRIPIRRPVVLTAISWRPGTHRFPSAATLPPRQIRRSL